jgi:uncharacterized protein (DUF1778 family)
VGEEDLAGWSADLSDARLTIRLTSSLRDAIGRCADRERRSVSNWIVKTLEDAVTAQEGSATASPVLKQR